MCTLLHAKGVSMQIFSFEIASDGAVVREGHSAVYYLIRCADAPPEFMVCDRNVKLLLLLPGPRALVNNEVVWAIILDWFAYMSPKGELPAASSQLGHVIRICLVLDHLQQRV